MEETATPSLVDTLLPLLGLLKNAAAEAGTAATGVPPSFVLKAGVNRESGFTASYQNDKTAGNLSFPRSNIVTNSLVHRSCSYQKAVQDNF